MRLRLLACAVALALPALSTPAHADVEYNLMQCDGTLSSGLLRKDSWTGSGTIACNVYMGTETYPPTLVDTFTVAISGSASNRPIVDPPPLRTTLVRTSSHVVATLRFRDYTLVVEDDQVCGTMPMVNVYDSVYDPDLYPYLYHVREGNLRESAQLGCDDPTGGQVTLHFVAEVLYDLPVTLPFV